MRALVVYESMFGNTRSVAEAVAEGLAGSMSVAAVEVGNAPPLGDVDVDLLVVGAPTHAFGLSREKTRQDAARRGGDVSSTGTGVREWLETGSPTELRVATFDTHVKKPNLPGWASHAAEKQLRRLHCRAVAKPATFYVHGYEGPLHPGELQRAKEWGASLGALVAGMSRSTR